MTVSITRRRFLRHAFSTGLLATLSPAGLFRLESWAAGGGPPIVWLEGAGCSGCLVSLADYYDPATDQGIEDVLTGIDLRYATLLMTASGEPAFQPLLDILSADTKQLILLVSGCIPNREGFCSAGTFQGRDIDFKPMLVSLVRKAKAVVGIGSCAAYGGMPGNRINEPRFAPLEHYLPPTTPLVLVPGCPPHPDWIVSVLMNAIAGQSLPLDRYKRPLSLFGRTVCTQCPRLAHKLAGRFAAQANDPELCLKLVGCRGEETHCDAPTRGWNESGSWCLSVNALCIGCTEPFFPDAPFVRLDPGNPET